MTMSLCQVFGNPVRVKLLLCLSKRAKNVTEMIQTCGLSQSAVSQHLGKLKSAGVVVAKKKGKEVFYALRNKKVADIGRMITILEREVS